MRGAHAPGKSLRPAEGMGTLIGNPDFLKLLERWNQFKPVSGIAFRGSFF